MEQIRINLFGRPHLTSAGQSYPMPDKFFVIVAILVCSALNSCGRRKIIESLWGSENSKRANASFRQLLVKVRAIEHRLETQLLSVDRDTICLARNDFDVDLGRLFCFKAPAATADTATDLSFILHTGQPFLDSINIDHTEFLDWRNPTENRILVARKAMIIQTIDLSHSSSDVATLAEELMMIDPSEELGYRILMEHHCEQDNRAEAKRVYQKCRRTLLSDYGVGPGLSTQQLAAALGLVEISGASESSKDTHEGTMDDGSQAAEAIASIGVPRIVLLPPKLVVGDVDTQIILEALLDDITAGLTRYRSISVLAAHTGRVQTNRDESIGSLYMRYGVHYAVTSSVKPTTTGTMTTFLLLDVRTEECLTAIDCPLDPEGLSDLFARVGKEVVRQLVSAIEVHEIEFPSAAAGRSGYRHYLEGRKSMWQSDLPDLRRARGAFQRALSNSNDFAPAYSGMSRTLSMEKLVRGLRADDLLLDAMEMAERAIRLDPLDGRGMCQRGFVSLYLRRHDESLECFAAAAALNPNDADMHADHADALSHAGFGEEALEACLQAKRLNPEWPDYYDWIHSSILYQLGSYGDAVNTLKKHNGNPVFCRLLAASTAMSGDTAEAARYAQMLKANYPDFSLGDLTDIVPDKNAQDTRHLMEGLKLAGVR